MTERERLLAFHQAIDQAGKELNPKEFHNLFSAVTAGSEGCYIVFEELEKTNAIPTEIICFDSPEKAYLKKEAYSHLSDDCLFIIGLVIDGPAEIFQLFLTDQQKRPTKTKIRKYLWKHERWLHTRIDEAFNELGSFMTIFD